MAGKAWIVLNGQQQLRRRLVKPAFEEIGLSHRDQWGTHTLARAQAQRGLEVLDRSSTGESVQTLLPRRGAADGATEPPSTRIVSPAATIERSGPASQKCRTTTGKSGAADRERGIGLLQWTAPKQTSCVFVGDEAPLVEIDRAGCSTTGGALSPPFALTFC